MYAVKRAKGAFLLFLGAVVFGPYGTSASAQLSYLGKKRLTLAVRCVLLLTPLTVTPSSLSDEDGFVSAAG